MRRIIVSLVLFLSVFFSINVARAEPVDAQDIYEVISNLPIAWADRNDVRKDGQLQTIAVAIDIATQNANWNDNDRVSLASYMITIGYHESRYRLKIHQGLKHAYSYGVWQVTPQSFHVNRTELIGLSYDETQHTAHIVASIIAKSWQCGYSPTDHFTAYYGGVPCKTSWKTLKERVATYYYVRNKLVKLAHEYDK